jgi:hypothetical protein
MHPWLEEPSAIWPAWQRAYRFLFLEVTQENKLRSLLAIQNKTLPNRQPGIFRLKQGPGRKKKEADWGLRTQTFHL